MSAAGLLLRPVGTYAFLRGGRTDAPRRPEVPRLAGATPPGRGPRRGRVLRGAEALIGAAAVTVAAAGGAVAVWDAAHPVQVHTVVRSAVPDVVAAAPATGAQVAASVLPSVVSIQARGATKLDSGTGIVIGSDGTVLTNNHVIANVATNGGSVTLVTADGGTSVAYVVGRDEGQDIAVVRAVGMSGMKPATLAASSSLHVGDTLYAVGQFMEFPGTVTQGIVSGLHRTITASSDEATGPEDALFGLRTAMPATLTLTDLIQTDVNIAPGNSGGPLVDDRGRVVGVNVACIADDAGGPGFAIPIERAFQVAQRLLRAAGAAATP